MFYILILLFGFSTAVLAQPNPDTLWTRTYGGNNDDEAKSIQQTLDGGYVVAGAIFSSGGNGSDFYVVKTNAQGNLLWTRTYGGSGHDEARSVQQTTDSGYVIAGSIYSPNGTGNDFYVVKTDGQGDTLWTHTYGGSSDDFAYSIQQTMGGGYIVAGYTWRGDESLWDFYVVKIDCEGIELWTRTYGGSSEDFALSIQQTADSGYVVAGYTYSFGGGGTDYYVVKTNVQGDELWTHTYGGSSDDEAKSIQQTADGGYVIAGYTTSFGAGSTDYYVVKTDAQGDALWTRTYGGIDDDAAYSIRQTTDGGYVVAGYTASFVAGGYAFYVVKTDGQGDLLWTRTYGGTDDDFSTSIQQTTDGGYVVAGYTDSFGEGDYDLYVVKTGPEVLGIEPGRAGAVPTDVALYQNYPNPFNPSTTISFDLPRESHVLLNIFDLTGRSVATLADETMNAGSHKVDFNAATLPSGVYVYCLNSNGNSQSRKLVLLK